MVSLLMRVVVFFVRCSDPPRDEYTREKENIMFNNWRICIKHRCLVWHEAADCAFPTVIIVLYSKNFVREQCACTYCEEKQSKLVRIFFFLFLVVLSVRAAVHAT